MLEATSTADVNSSIKPVGNQPIVELYPFVLYWDSSVLCVTKEDRDVKKWGRASSLKKGRDAIVSTLFLT